jgi:hypothetical protein
MKTSSLFRSFHLATAEAVTKLSIGNCRSSYQILHADKQRLIKTGNQPVCGVSAFSQQRICQQRL